MYDWWLVCVSASQSKKMMDYVVMKGWKHHQSLMTATHWLATHTTPACNMSGLPAHHQITCYVNTEQRLHYITLHVTLPQSKLEQLCYNNNPCLE